MSIIISRRSKHSGATEVCHGIHFPTKGCGSASALALSGRTMGWAIQIPTVNEICFKINSLASVKC